MRTFVETNGSSVEQRSEAAASRVENPRYASLRLQRDSFRCVACGRSPATDAGVVLHLDHIVPFSEGGRTNLENLRTTCADCNLGKGDAS